MAAPKRGEFLPLPTDTRRAEMGWDVTGDPGTNGFPGGFMVVIVLLLLILAFFNRAKFGLKFGRKSK